jgi:molybdopterin synthase catalytic subunit
VGLLVRSQLALEPLLAEVCGHERGGTAVFLGSVRNGPDERRAPGDGVTGIEYSAYDDMAERELATILQEARDRWPGVRVTARHRLGLVPVGDASIAIAAAAPHRLHAFEACRYVIEAVKRRVPIWKKEYHADGSASWVDAYGLPVQAAPPVSR